MSLSGKHALVCGASDGIGRATAFALAEKGAEITILARSENKLESLLSQLENAGASSAHFVAVDLEDSDALKSAVSAHLSAVGHIQILVNNSGGPPAGPLLQASEEEFLKPLRRHLFAAHALVGLLLPGMVESNFGRIVNIISTSVREPIANLGVSNTVRGAMASWSKTLATELPPMVSINNVLPGFTDTGRLSSLAESIAAKEGITPDAVKQRWIGQVPAGRLAEPEETAATIAFLCSEEAAYIRGSSIAVDGGRLRSI